MYENALQAGLAAAPGAQAATPREQPQMMAAVKRHAELLAMLSERVLHLHQRLEPVLRPVPPTEASNKASSGGRGGLAGLAQAFHEASDQLMRDISVLEDIHNRLEL